MRIDSTEMDNSLVEPVFDGSATAAMTARSCNAAAELPRNGPEPVPATRSDRFAAA